MTAARLRLLPARRAILTLALALLVALGTVGAASASPGIGKGKSNGETHAEPAPDPGPGNGNGNANGHDNGNENGNGNGHEDANGGPGDPPAEPGNGNANGHDNEHAPPTPPDGEEPPTVGHEPSAPEAEREPPAPPPAVAALVAAGEVPLAGPGSSSTALPPSADAPAAPPSERPAPRAHAPEPAASPFNPPWLAPALAPAPAPRPRKERVLGRWRATSGSVELVPGAHGATGLRAEPRPDETFVLSASRSFASSGKLDPYRVSAWLRTDTPGVTVCLRFLEVRLRKGKPDRLVRSSESCVAPTDEWERFAFDALSTAKGNTLRVSFSVYGAFPGETFEVSRLKIERRVRGRWIRLRTAASLQR